MKEGVKNMRSECASSIYLDITPEVLSDNNNIQPSWNKYTKYDYVFPLVSNDRIIHTKTLRGPKPFQDISKLARNENDFLS